MRTCNEVSVCCKCGNPDIVQQYHRGAGDPRCNCPLGKYGEHIAAMCKNCGYHEPTQCLK